MGDSFASYIHMVHHLIEKCLIFRMTKEECMETLSKHANIKPVITSTVWNELEKENKEFFKSYAESRSKDDRISDEETSQMRAWNELEKENKEFFESYADSRSKDDRILEEETSQMIQKKRISDPSKPDDHNQDD